MIRLLFTLLMASLLSSCGDEASNTSTLPSSTEVTITLGGSLATGALQGANNIPQNIQSVSVQAFTAAGESLFFPVFTSRPYFTLSVHLLNADGVRFVVRAWDQPNARGSILYTGQSVANLKGIPLVVPVVMSLAIAVLPASDVTTIPRNGSLAFSALVGGVSPTAASPLLWTASAGTFTSNMWTAPNTLGAQTITAQIDPSVNADQNAAIVGTFLINVVNQKPSVTLAVGEISVGRGGLKSVALNSVDPDAMDTVGLSFNPALPVWLVYNAATGSLDAQPSLNTALGAYTTNITPKDNLGLVGPSSSLTIAVVNSRWDQFKWDTGTWN